MSATTARLGRALETTVKSERQTLDLFAARLSAVDPVRTLARGWSITRTASGTVVRQVADVSAGDTLVTTVADGTITSTATDTD
jgi:exodeoxyribonuclease VII large subunit